MTFLPIVGRELREGARRSGTYWLRVRVAAQALLVGVVAYIMALVNPAFKLGTPLFWGLSGVSMLFCLLAGRRSTADCISQEKREGTLGLLFLTDLKGYDIVLGKLAATSISGFFGLMAIFPVLAIPLLTGGMTNGELWRMALVLANTFLLSVAIGIFASAVSREYRTATAVNFFIALLLMAAPAGVGIGLDTAGSRWFSPRWYYSCPIFSFVYCGDAEYAKRAADFWWSVEEQGGLALLLVLLACLIVPRAWSDIPAAAPSRKWRWRDLGTLINYGSPAKRAAFRKRALDVNAFYWLAGRARLKPAHVWLFLAAAAIWFFYGWLRFPGYWIELETFVTTGVIINSTLKLWITVEAGHRFGEDRRAGAFELLLATPLTVRDFLRGQILALRRQFFKPLLVVTGLEMAFVLALIFPFNFAWRGNIHPHDDLLESVRNCLAGVVMLWADVIALVWVAMAAAFTCKSQTKATTFTVARILILPWAVFGLLMFAANVGFSLGLMTWQTSGRFGLGLWFGLGLGADLLYGLAAWRKLTKNFRQLAVQSFVPERSPPLWRVLLRKAARGLAVLMRPIPRRARKPLAACLIAGLALGVITFARRPVRIPPPVLVSITQSNAPLRIFVAREGALFVMPDGSLWRWGKTGAPQSPRAARPEQIGAGRDWVKAVAAGTHCLGLRADGTIWGWGFSVGRYIPGPQPAVQGHDWVDVATGFHHAAAVRRDGTLWTWNEPLAGRNEAAQTMTNLGPGNNWIAVSCGNESTFALRADGTLWVGGHLFCQKRGIWTNATFEFPTLLCAESNWIALDATRLARNRAGELWDVSRAMPDAQAGVAAVCGLVTSNWASDRVQSVSSTTPIQVRADGTLWIDLPWPMPGNWSQVGARTDWLAVWDGQSGTGFGLTADGTVWTWGYDFGKDPDTFASRLQVLRNRIAYGLNPYGPYPYSLQPRALLKLDGSRQNEGK